MAANYTFGGYSDWYLPSRDELEAMRDQKALVGDSLPCFYYKSSERSNQAFNGYPYAAWVAGGNIADQHYEFYRSQTGCVGVRAIRTVQ